MFAQRDKMGKIDAIPSYPLRKHALFIHSKEYRLNHTQNSSTVVPRFLSRASWIKSPPVTKSINPNPTLL